VRSAWCCLTCFETGFHSEVASPSTR
jgi:hypothetical protein